MRTKIVFSLLMVIFLSVQHVETAHGDDDSQNERQLIATSTELAWRSALRGVSPEVAKQRLFAEILMNWQQEVNCAEGWFGGVSQWACLAGLRQLIHALSLMGDKASNPQVLGFESITVGPAGNWKVSGNRWENLTVIIPFNGTAGQIANWLVFHGMNPQRHADRIFLTQLEQSAESLEERHGIEIRAEPDLSPPLIAKGMERIVEALEALQNQATQNALQMNFRTLIFTNSSRAPREAFLLPMSEVSRRSREELRIDVHLSPAKILALLRQRVAAKELNQTRE